MPYTQQVQSTPAVAAWIQQNVKCHVERRSVQSLVLPFRNAVWPNNRARRVSALRLQIEGFAGKTSRKQRNMCHDTRILRHIPAALELDISIHLIQCCGCRLNLPGKSLP